MIYTFAEMIVPNSDAVKDDTKQIHVLLRGTLNMYIHQSIQTRTYYLYVYTHSIFLSVNGTFRLQLPHAKIC